LALDGSLIGQHITSGFVQVRLDVEPISSKSLLCFIQAGHSTMDFYFLTSSFVILLGCGSGRDQHLFRTCNKALPVVRKHKQTPYYNRDQCRQLLTM
jgi:hypothetical protein